ncbi:hypothetical protein [Streptomyces ortus]|uniref:Uncharacterized protein n=1 Tax=Streptomyces ortus TaxID=2867268 RepID=A0ABT3V7A1_9ACTN|nr:hypothetical protein [Streptomyces ortus]MCX4234163.1 hypothetical protein [Streptomyces ortus]
MEQRIGPNIQPLQGAAVDPAAVPGITGPRPAEPAAKPKSSDAASSGTTSDDSATKLTKEEQEPSTTERPTEAAKPDEPDATPAPAPAPDGAPVFEASDRRAKVVADHRGVRLTLDDQEAEFRWDEIGAVETESPRFGKRFTLTVHTPDRRWYFLEIEAKSRSDFKTWETDLDKVLDAYFEDESQADGTEADETKAEEPKADEPDAQDPKPQDPKPNKSAS